jgi:hypothetical protein
LQNLTVPLVTAPGSFTEAVSVTAVPEAIVELGDITNAVLVGITTPRTSEAAAVNARTATIVLRMAFTYFSPSRTPIVIWTLRQLIAALRYSVHLYLIHD